MVPQHPKREQQEGEMGEVAADVAKNVVNAISSDKRTQWKKRIIEYSGPPTPETRTARRGDGEVAADDVAKNVVNAISSDKRTQGKKRIIVWDM